MIIAALHKVVDFFSGVFAFLRFLLGYAAVQIKWHCWDRWRKGARKEDHPFKNSDVF